MVLTFVNALNACDHKTIRALTTAGYTSSATRWCDRGTHDVQVAGFRIGGASDRVDLTFKVRHRDIILGERLWMNDFHRRCRQVAAVLVEPPVVEPVGPSGGGARVGDAARMLDIVVEP